MNSIKKYYKRVFKSTWFFINSNVFVFGLLTIFFGFYFLPNIISNAQLQYQSKQKNLDLKYNFSTNLMKLAYKKKFLALNYFLNYKTYINFYGDKELQLWNLYYETNIDWNTELGIDYFVIKKYYGIEAMDSFDSLLALPFNNLHDELLKIHNHETVDDQKISSLLDGLNGGLWGFSEKINAP